ncbi:MAG: 50S ribosomal protein L4 [Hadesarchaea archaeon]|nr:50S ribosomal protein L4 [Hadesarchaea archaeon]
MKVGVYSVDGERVGEIELPPIFEEEIRPDVIKRAFHASHSARIQPWAPDVMAGKRTTAEPWGKGHGVSRVPRVKGRRYSAAGRGAFSPSTVGGRRAHPPKVEKKLRERINRKERRLAIRSAIAATKDEKLVSLRGHVIKGIKELPLIVSDEFEKMGKSKRVQEAIQKLGAWGDVERAKKSKKIRAGRGKMRGRRYRQAVAPLIVVGGDCELMKAGRNLPGVEVVPVDNLNAELLAPGGIPGRLTIWTESAIRKLAGGMFS